MFQKKTWKPRASEFPTRRTLTDTTTGTVQTVNVARAEGTVTEQGDGFSAENMNDLETRIANGLSEKQSAITATGILKGSSGSVTAAEAGTDYVAPVSGKGLSTNDYTTTEKNKLAGLSAPVAVTVTLAAASWVEGTDSATQTVNVTGVTATNSVIVQAAPASREAWLEADVYCSAQGAGTLTFTCETAPESVLTANVLILGVAQ